MFFILFSIFLTIRDKIFNFLFFEVMDIVFFISVLIVQMKNSLYFVSIGFIFMVVDNFRFFFVNSEIFMDVDLNIDFFSFVNFS